MLVLTLSTTTAAHGLSTGNFVVFSNLCQTSTTGMQQIAGIPFKVLRLHLLQLLLLDWDTSDTNYTAIATLCITVL